MWNKRKTIGVRIYSLQVPTNGFVTLGQKL